MRHPQALGQQKLKLGAEPLTPMAQVGALVREAVLEELLAGEVLKVGVVDPALAHLFIGQAEDVLEKHQSDHEARRNPGPALVAVERSDLLVEVLPIEPAGELDQLMLHVDDLIEPGPEQITFPSRLVLLRPHRPLRCSTESLFAPKGNPKNQIARFRALKPENLAISKPPAAQKMTLSQALSCCSRATGYSALQAETERWNGIRTRDSMITSHVLYQSELSSRWWAIQESNLHLRVSPLLSMS